jgi:hypothetical protein
MVPTPHTKSPERQANLTQATAAQHRDHRTHTTHEPGGRSASARPPPARARREEHYLCPPISPQVLPGIRVAACIRFCCAAVSITFTGELLHRYTTVHEPGGVLPIACKTRRASRCPPCAEVYREDTYQLIRAGLSGGKGVPETVANHPCVFATLTAPSFGPVHVYREKDGRLLRCRPRRRGQVCSHGNRLSCPERHSRDDARLGEPLCSDCYDYTGAVLFNACAPELWRRFTITLRRSLARLAGLTSKALAAQVRISFAKVAEYQRRGVVHFHAIIRLDGPAGPTTAPPAWAAVARQPEQQTAAFALVRSGGQGRGRTADLPLFRDGDHRRSGYVSWVRVPSACTISA